MIRNREILLYTIFAAVFTIMAVIFCITFSEFSFAIVLASCTCVYAVCMMFTMRRYRKIAKLSDYLQKLASGKPALDIRENAEGELSILKNEIYKVTTAMSEQTGTLQRDKLELSNALSDISHQLKTPLTSLGIMTDLLDNDELPPEKRKEFIVSLRAGQQRMEWLVLSLLKLAKLDSDTVTLKKELAPLSSVVEKAAESLLIPMEIKNQTITVEGEDASVICDIDWTAEALCNIIKNAAQNTPEGGHIGITYGKNPLYFYITVRDNGPGIAREDMPHLFQRFYRGRKAGSNSVGIGLAMSLAIMQKQNGDIEIENDNGAVFTMKFYQGEIEERGA